MTVLTANEVAWLVRQTPWQHNPQHAAIAIAITVPESGRNTNAHNPIPPDNSYGLWQINMIDTRGMGTERRAKYHLASNEDLFNPLVNVKVAYGIYADAGHSFKPWTAYLTGSYLPHLNAARLAFAAPKPPDIRVEQRGDDLIDRVGGTVSDVVGGIPNPIDALSFVSDPHNWLRLAMFVGGGMLLLVALWALLLQTGAGRVAAGALPSGRMAKVAKGLAQ